VSNEDYHDDTEYESSTTLKLFDSDPYTYWRSRIAKQIPVPRPAAESVNLGSAFEIKLLEPELFDKCVAVCRDGGYRSAAFRKFTAGLPRGVVPITQEDCEKIPLMLDSVHASNSACALLSKPGGNQVSLRWCCPQTGIKLKCRFDRVLDDGRVVQLKTSRDPTAEAFAKQAYDLQYHVAEQLYLDGFALAYEAGILDAPGHGSIQQVYLVVGNDEPFETYTWHLDEDSQELGAAELERILFRLAAFRERYGSNGKPWHSEEHGTISPLRLPPWAFKKASY
jgi:exodeoxyribonuclease VIII